MQAVDIGNYQTYYIILFSSEHYFSFIQNINFVIYRSIKLCVMRILKWFLIIIYCPSFEQIFYLKKTSFFLLEKWNIRLFLYDKNKKFILLLIVKIKNIIDFLLKYSL